MKILPSIPKSTNFDLVKAGICPHDGAALLAPVRTKGVGFKVDCPKCGQATRVGHKIIEKKKLKGYAFGHAGSGNLHMEIMGLPEEKAQWQKVREAEEEIVSPVYPPKEIWRPACPICRKILE
jgi:DNA-directed RNA polymerase subunit M/transcription elongation factor TFIIS